MSKRSALWLTGILLFTTVASAAGPELKTQDDKTIYALGVAVSRQLEPFNLTPSEVATLNEGLSDALLHRKLKITESLQSFGPKFRQMAQARSAVVAAAEKKAGEAYLAKAAATKGAVKTASGLVYEEQKAGTGNHPKPTDRVKVQYTGKLIDGTVFDSSVARGQPAVFPLNGVIKCWTEGLQRMRVGGKARLVCPSDLAYGDHGSPPKIKPGATLVFDVELLGIEKK